MGQIEQLVKSKLLGNDNPNNLVWPITKTRAVYDKTNTDLQTVLDSLGSEIQEIKEINNVSVRYDQVQELTEEQKGTARNNIDAGTYSKPEGGIPASDLADDVLELELRAKPEDLTQGDSIETILGFSTRELLRVGKCWYWVEDLDNDGKVHYTVTGFEGSPAGNQDAELFFMGEDSAILVLVDINFQTVKSVKIINISNSYQKPSTGIPASDLASSVQTSLGKADNALQGIILDWTAQNKISLTDLATAYRVANKKLPVFVDGAGMRTWLDNHGYYINDSRSFWVTSIVNYGEDYVVGCVGVEDDWGETDNVIFLSFHCDQEDDGAISSINTSDTKYSGKVFDLDWQDSDGEPSRGVFYDEIDEIISAMRVNDSSIVRISGAGLTEYLEDHGYSNVSVQYALVTSITSNNGYTICFSFMVNGNLAYGTLVLNSQGTHVSDQFNLVYAKPSGGIPASDLTQTAQTSLGKADTALQSADLTFIKGTGTGSAVLKGGGATATGQFAVAEGAAYSNTPTAAAGDASHAEGAATNTKAQAAHSEGLQTIAGRTLAEAQAALSVLDVAGTTEQKVSKLIGFASHSEGSSTQALGTSSHAEGYSTQALVNATHAEGDTTTASGEAAHSEGYKTTASGNQSHSEGFNTQATANQAHSEGKKTIASAENAHSEGNETKAVGNASHSEGYRTEANNASEHAEGRYNKSNKASTTFGNSGNTIHSVGIGASSGARTNAFEIMQNGDIYVKGLGSYNGTNPAAAQTLKQVIDAKGTYSKPSGGIPASDLASGVIPTVPQISTNITTDASSNTKTASPKAVKDYVDANGMKVITYGSSVSEIPSAPLCYVPRSDVLDIIPDAGSADDQITSEPGVYLTRQDYSDAEENVRYSGIYSYYTFESNASVHRICVVTALYNAGDWELEVHDLYDAIPTTEIFWATYGITTASEIATALTAGKLVACNCDSRVYILTDNRSTSTEYFFTCMLSATAHYYIKCNKSTSNWSGNSATNQTTSNLVSTLSGNESDTTKYPNCKAVADAISNSLGDIETLLNSI